MVHVGLFVVRPFPTLAGILGGIAEILCGSWRCAECRENLSEPPAAAREGATEEDGKSGDTENEHAELSAI